MAKKIFRLTESDLRRVIKESVNNIIKESHNYSEETNSLISSARESIDSLMHIGRFHLSSLDDKARENFFQFVSYLGVVERNGLVGPPQDEDWYYQERTGEVADEDDLDWFNISADGYTTPSEKEDKFIRRFGNPEDQDEYYSGEKISSDVDAAWKLHDRQIKNGERSYKNALKSADKRPLYKKGSPNYNIPKK